MRKVFLSLLLLSASALATTTTCFSPDGQCDERLWKWLQGTQKSLDIAVFDLTHPKIAHEILVASKRVPVRVVVDRRQAKGEHSLVEMMIKAGANVRIGRQRGIMHNKFAVRDGKQMMTGSFNWSTSATERNAENQIYLDEAPIVAAYHEEFEKLWDKAKPADSLRSVAGRSLGR